MLPPAFLTVATPSWTSHDAADLSLTLTHSSRFSPSKRMMASEGGAPKVDPGATTAGLGVQISVSSGLGFGLGGSAGCWAWAAIAADKKSAGTERWKKRENFIRGSLHRGAWDGGLSWYPMSPKPGDMGHPGLCRRCGLKKTL